MMNPFTMRCTALGFFLTALCGLTPVYAAAIQTHNPRSSQAIPQPFGAQRKPKAVAKEGSIEQDTVAHTVTMADFHRNLLIRLNYDGRCVLDRIEVSGREVIAPESGVYTGIESKGFKATTQSGIANPTVRLSGNTVNVEGISYSAGDMAVREQWRFTVKAHGIDWRIRREYLSAGHIDDSSMPSWDFTDMNTWTGAMLNTGGVAWCHLLGENATYGAHANAVTFWKPGQRDALRITSSSPTLKTASRFSHLPSGKFSYIQSSAPKELVTKHALRRYLNAGTDLWAPFQVEQGSSQIEMKLQALDYVSTYGRGNLKGIDGPAVTELLNTIGRYGVIDRNHVSGNGWVTGFICLHEPFYGALAVALDDPDYIASLARSLDDWRDHAILPDGRIRTRWVYDAGMDNMVPGSFDPATGYYDCGWGSLLDAQPDYPINVAETFDFTGDKKWLQSHKRTCERVLDWMLTRNVDGSGLMTMLTDSHKQRKSSDWIDIVFASGKNALVNAEMYRALTLWAEREEILGDSQHAARYLAAAQKLKKAFVQPISRGGFWDPQKGFFVYWLEKDGSAHGDNLVPPVNFCAIAYGICKNSQRKSILYRIEAGMLREKLFHWPLCFTSYKADECLGMMPFPAYENGDIFLSWGELGVRAYADYNPAIALKYVRAILDQHKKDGLAFQRYLRQSQKGAGEDILAGNSMTVAGLYRDIYGIRPQWNRLILDPHLTPELAGTRLSYKLRNQRYNLVFGANRTTVTVNDFTINSTKSFAVHSSGNRLTYFTGTANREAISLTKPAGTKLAIEITSWPQSGSGLCSWAEMSVGNSLPIHHVISGLAPSRSYRLVRNGIPGSTLVTDAQGKLRIDLISGKNRNSIALIPVSKIIISRRSSKASFAAAIPVRSPATITRMTCEYLVNPLGIDETKPRLSWIEKSPEKGYHQSAYRILVSSSTKKLKARVGDLWDSGKIQSSNTTLITYQGSALKSRLQCWWAVQAWDSKRHLSAWSTPATFSMGLLSKQDWKASWIGKDVQASQYDLSGLKDAKWLWLPGIAQPEVVAPLGKAYFRLAFKLPAGRAIKRARYIGTADNEFTLYVNGTAAGKSSDWYQLQTIDVTRLINGETNQLAIEAHNIGDAGPNPAGLIGALKIEYRDGGSSIIRTGPAWKASPTVESGWNTSSYDDSSWRLTSILGRYGMQPWGDVTLSDAARHPDLPARYLRHEFTTSKRIVKAVAYMCGLGFFQLYVNGKLATDHIMDPALSDYKKAVYYVTMDVTSLIKNGENAIGAALGNGRFHSPRLSIPITTENFGAPRLLFQLEITHADGTKQLVVSDRSWKVTDRGPIRANNEYDGEVYDARMEMAGWANSGFSADSKRWSPADIMAAPGGVLQAQMMEPMRITQTVKPVKISSPKPGKYIVDMGRTFYGAVRLKARAKRGTAVRMTSAYALLPDGTLKTADNRSALATDIYTFSGKGDESWNPVFKGQGFRRVQVSGFPGKPATSNFEGLIEQSDTRQVGSFSCSNELVNKIHDAMRTGMTMFLRSAPLDPDRDERQPWMGDPAKDSESEAYNFNVAAFYTKWMDDVHRSQRLDGSIPDVSMYWSMGNGVEWPSVFTIIPEWFTGFYGDTRLIQKHYEAMKHWVLAMRSQHGLQDGTLQGVGYGDWCDAYSIGGKVGDNGLTPLDLVATAYQYNNVRIVQRAAERLGKTDDAVMWRDMGDGLYKAFMSRFYDPAACTYSSGTQCSYVLPLAFGLTPSDLMQRQKIVDNLAHDIIVTHDGHLTVGLIGNQWLLQVLTQFGRADVAWRLVTQTTKPSWGYMINKGSNTIWERWDYDTRDPGMNSEALLIQAGNVDAWFYQTLGGINYDPKQPGFAHILIKPQILGELKWVKCHFDSPRGRIVSDWTRNGSNVTFRITIPANTTATVTTPDGKAQELLSGSWTLKSQLK